MNNLIKRIDIKGFRSIERLNINSTPINVFSGINDVGKSNILKALNLFFNNQTDFLKPLKFDDDYNKISKAKAIRSAKTKQLIKIRIYLNPPKTYKSLSKLNKIYIERQFDRYGNRIEVYCSDDYKVKRAINTLINKVKYIYIPALKGEIVLQYLLSLIGEKELISENNISALNDEIKDKTVDLKEILQKSGIDIGTTFGLPTLLSDFWQKLSVNTTYDYFNEIDNTITGSRKRELNKNLFNIPLMYRGEGIKSKYIPPLLQWLDKNDKTKTFIWGIDEPENSLEFGLANKLANLYYNEYAKTNQIFLTSHSLAFINPQDNIKIIPSIFKVYKDQLGRTLLEDFKTLFKKQDKLLLLDELGLLIAQKELIDNYRASITKINEFEKVINSYETNILFVEGPSDKEIIERAFSILYPDYELERKFTIEHSSLNGGGHSWVKDMLISWHFNREKANKNIKAVGVFDFDIDSNNSIKEVNNILNHRNIKVLKLTDVKPEHLIDIFRKGIKIPFAIEDFFPPEFMIKLKNEKQEWFTEKTEIIKYNSFDNLTKSFYEYCIEKGITENEKIYLMKIKKEYKKNFSNYVCSNDVEVDIFTPFKNLIEAIIGEYN